MSDDPTLAGPPTFTLASPGVGTTWDPEALESPYGTYVVHLGPGRRLRTVEWFPGRHSEAPRMAPSDAVEWDVTVPPGAEIFSVRGSVSAARVRQFWVGWLIGRQVHMEPLDGLPTLSSTLEPDERPVFPAVMDGSGAASFYSWRRSDTGSALWQRQFSKWSAADANKVTEVPGECVLSGATSVPGLRSRHAVVGWIEQDPSSGAVLGIALVEEGRRTVVKRSQPIPVSAPFVQQRMDVWAGSPDTFQAAALVLDDRGYQLILFTVDPESPDGQLEKQRVPIQPGEVVRAAFDYHRSDRARLSSNILLRDGRLIDESGRVIREGVPSDNVLPVVLAAGTYWRVRKADGTFDLEPL